MIQGQKEKGMWDPYLAGALSGAALVFSVWLSGEYFGASTSFVRTAGMIEEIFAAERVSRMEYFLKEVPKVEWQWMFVAGILVGSFISSVTSGSFRWKALPDMWASRFGTSLSKRAAAAFLGGVIAIFGARLAGGCTSGHGLSGTLQLSVSSLLVTFSFLTAGVLMARALYARRKDR
jgi:uncharacterized membrane protein YedE/YeeE